MSGDAEATCAICGGRHATEACATRDGRGRRAVQEPSEAAQGLGVGDRVGGYLVVDLLGSGASANVYLGTHTVLGNQVAVKALRPELHEDAELVRRFVGEARATNQVRHQHILEILEIGRFEGWQQYNVMELLRGKTLKDAMGAKPWGLDQVVPILLQVCEALSAAHGAGVVHRDLKPDNIYLTMREGRPFVKILDFGSARRATLSEGEARTTIGTVLGTANYMAPEQALGKPVDGRADVYALGGIMFHLATGRVPFQGKSIGELLAAVTTTTPPRPTSLNPLIGSAWESVILRCLAKVPGDRFGTVADLGRALIHAQQAPDDSIPDEVASPQPTVIKDVALVEAPDVAQATVVAEARSVSGSASPLRYTTSFAVRVATEGGFFPESVLVTDISMGGMYLATQHTIPPVFSRITVRVPTPEGPVDFAAEVVRVEDRAEGRRGFAVHFRSLDDAQSAALRALLARIAPVEKVAAGDDPELARVLGLFTKASASDHYAILGITLHLGSREIRDAYQRRASSTDPTRFPKMSPAQRNELDALRARLKEAESVLTDLGRRAQYDASRGNFAGVAQCMREGLTVDQLAKLRATYLAEHPGTEAAIRPHLGQAKTHESKGEVDAASRAVARALEVDALNIGLQRTYWDLRRQVRPKPA